MSGKYLAIVVIIAILGWFAGNTSVAHGSTSVEISRVNLIWDSSAGYVQFSGTDSYYVECEDMAYIDRGMYPIFDYMQFEDGSFEYGTFTTDNDVNCTFSAVSGFDTIRVMVTLDTRSSDFARDIAYLHSVAHVSESRDDDSTIVLSATMARYAMSDVGVLSSVVDLYRVNETSVLYIPIAQK